MEHVTGETLAARLEKGPLPPDRALTVATGFGDAQEEAVGDRQRRQPVQLFRP